MYHHRAQFSPQFAIREPSNFQQNVVRESNPRIRRDKGENNNFVAYEIVKES